jgi:hypothetical protein
MDYTVERTAAERRVRAKLGFIGHATTYVLVMALLALINLMTNRAHLWFVWPLLGWGIGLAWHGIAVFALSRGAFVYDRMVDRELHRRA